MSSNNNIDPDLIASITAKRRKLRNLIVQRWGSLAHFAIVFDLDYNALCSTISGRYPQAECVTRILEECKITAAEFPRLPKRWNSRSKHPIK